MKAFNNINYKKGSSHKRHLLDIYTPEKEGKFPVLIFVHGGSWYHGSKDWYYELGQHLANKNFVTVIVNYRLGQEVTYDLMADDVASSAKWVNDHIDQYNGDCEKIFISGHSAGGHLSALISLNTRFFSNLKIKNPLKGCILIDAFGLNMDYIMSQNSTFYVTEMRNVFTKKSDNWKDAAPVHFISASSIPFLIFVGSHTYPPLSMDNQVFKMHLEAKGVPFTYKTVRDKDHTGMITVFKNDKDPIYDDIINFIVANSKVKESV